MGFVYLIGESENENKYKIGVTRNKDIIKRKKKLQTGNPNELIIKNYFESKHPFKLEKMLHRYFNDKKVINEWFNLNEEEINNFKNICSKYEDIIISLEDNPFFFKK